MYNIHDQVRVFLSFLFLGALSGIVIDVYRAWHVIFLPPRKILFFLDLFLWLILALILLPGFFLLTWGELRFPHFIALGLGLLLYFYYYSQLFLPLWLLCFQLLGKILQRGGRFFYKIKNVKQKP